MLRFCGNIASSSCTRTFFARRNFVTNAARKQPEYEQRDVEELFTAAMPDTHNKPEYDDIPDIQNRHRHAYSDIPETQSRRRHAFSLNRVELIGGIGGDPIARVNKSGNEYVTFNLFTNIETRNHDGSYREQNEMHNIHVFGASATFVKNNFSKGNRVMVIGYLHYDGGHIRPDGTRAPRITSITAETILPINRPQQRDMSE